VHRHARYRKTLSECATGAGDAGGNVIALFQFEARSRVAPRSRRTSFTVAASRAGGGRLSSEFEFWLAGATAAGSDEPAHAQSVQTLSAAAKKREMTNHRASMRQRDAISSR
jgi:hypothetical protein